MRTSLWTRQLPELVRFADISAQCNVKIKNKCCQTVQPQHLATVEMVLGVSRGYRQMEKILPKLSTISYEFVNHLI